MMSYKHTQILLVVLCVFLMVSYRSSEVASSDQGNTIQTVTIVAVEEVVGLEVAEEDSSSATSPEEMVVFRPVEPVDTISDPGEMPMKSNGDGLIKFLAQPVYLYEVVTP